MTNSTKFYVMLEHLMTVVSVVASAPTPTPTSTARSVSLRMVPVFMVMTVTSISAPTVTSTSASCLLPFSLKVRYTRSWQCFQFVALFIFPM